MNTILLYCFAVLLSASRKPSRDGDRVWKMGGYSVKMPMPFEHQVWIATLAVAMILDTIYQRSLIPLHDLFLILSITEFSSMEKRLSWVVSDESAVHTVSHDYVVAGCIASTILLSPSFFYLSRELAILAGLSYVSDLVLSPPGETKKED